MPAERYELLGPLGQGGQASTYRARDRQTGATVAVKVLSLRTMEGWKPYDLFQREGQVLQALDHPDIPRYLDAFADEAAGRCCLVMELIEGASLEAVLAGKRTLGAGELERVLLDVLAVLAYLHERHPPVIHRDLKPANLVLRPNGRVAVVDFGGVRVALRPEGGSTVVGTFGYLAPEQLHGEATAATDLYSLGVTICALGAGLAGDHLPRKGLKVDVSQCLPAGRLRDAVEPMVEPDPAQRTKSAREVQTRLVSPSPLPVPSTPQGSRLPAPLGLVGRLAATIFWLAGVAGSVAFKLLDILVVGIFLRAARRRAAHRPRRQARIQRRTEQVHAAMEDGRRALLALSAAMRPHALGQGPAPERLSNPKP